MFSVGAAVGAAKEAREGAEWPDLSTTFTLGEGDRIGWFSIDEALELPDLPDVAKEDLRRFLRTRGSS